MNGSHQDFSNFSPFFFSHILYDRLMQKTAFLVSCTLAAPSTKDIEKIVSELVRTCNAMSVQIAYILEIFVGE